MIIVNILLDKDHKTGMMDPENSTFFALFETSSLNLINNNNETQITNKTYKHEYLALYMCAVLVHILVILILWLLFAKDAFKDSFYKDKNISSISDNFI